MNILDSKRSRQGVIYGVLSYGLWGLIPLYFKLVAHVSPLEVLAHRVLWSLVLLAIVITLLRRWGNLLPALRSRKVLLTLCASTLLLSLNWFTYIYAVSTNQVVAASLGYFLNPLVNVLIGVTLLKERMRRWQSASVLLAGVGVAMLGAPPIALTLALSFAFYALLRKTVAVDGLLGLFIETLLLLPLSVGFIVYLEATHVAAFVVSDAATCGKLMASGVVTAVPLLLFTAAARRLRFSTLGFLQYLAPTIQFGLAVTRFGEPMTAEKLAAFGCIWMAVAIYSIDSLRSYQQQRSSESLRPVPVE
ncbi:MAG TPA: EamA family transporter RarD [Pirellulales bacterium]|nr:EamA family transporter RarD [Pirellulales bacterium]